MIQINGKTLCEKCFLPLAEGAAECAHCTQPDNCSRFPTALPEKTVLRERYFVGKVLGKGGFGITYLCYDSVTDRRVCVKEYLPDTLTHRNTGETAVTAFEGDREQFFRTGAEKFCKEAQMVSTFNGNPNIISVFESFYENNTAYYVMEYLEGEDLKQYLAKRGKTLTEGQAVYVANRVCDALMIVHSQEILHRDISPDNIFICNDGKIKLLDFGAARQVLDERSQSLSVILKQGYAPLEQYQRDGKQGPWTDIYALGASLYYALTGHAMDDAMTRLNGAPLDMSSISPALAKVLRRMLAVQSSLRIKDTFKLKQKLAKTQIVPRPLVGDDASTIDSSTVHSIDKNVLTQDVINVQQLSEENKNFAWRNKLKSLGGTLSELLSMIAAFLPKSEALKKKIDALRGWLRPRLDALAASIRKKPDDVQPAVVLPQHIGDETIAVDDPNYVNDILNDVERIRATRQKKKKALLIGGAMAAAILVWLLILIFSDGLYIGMGQHAGGFIAFHYIIACGLLLAAVGSVVYGRMRGEKIYLTPYLAGCAVLFWMTLIPIYSMPHVYMDNATLLCYSPFYRGEITIPDGVTEIGAGAFEGSDVKTIAVPEGVTAIGANAFRNCAVTSVLLPESLQSIGEEAFSGSAITSITLPSNLTTIGAKAFSGCKLSSIVLPQGVTNIGKGVFENCTDLVSVTLSDSTTTISENAFSGCTGLRSISLPVTMEKIGQSAFADCSELTKIVLPNKIESLGKSAFSGCKSLTSVNIPTSLTKVETSVFSGCESLKSIKFPKTLKEIGESSFKQTGLTTVSIPESITQIRSGAFLSCTNLGKIVLPRGIRLYGDVYPEALRPTWYNARRIGFIAAGEQFTLAIRADGKVAATGENKKNQCKVGDWSQIIAVAAGQAHTVGLRADGTVVATGDNTAGQCNVKGWKNIMMIAAGSNHTVGLRADGKVVATGNNRSGECNVKDWTDIVAIAAGFAHTVGLRADGTVVATGYREDGRCSVDKWKNVVSIAANNTHTVGLLSNGTVVATGNNEDGQCNVKGWKNIVAISAGYFHTVGLKADGTAVAVGFNSKDGRCNVKDWKSIVAISAGDWHTIGLRSDGTLVAVGNKQHKQCNVTQWTNLKLPPT